LEKLNGANPYAPREDKNSKLGVGGKPGGGGSTHESELLGGYKYGGSAAAVELAQRAGVANSMATGFAQNAEWDQTKLSKTGEGKGQYAGNVSAFNDFDAQSAAWEARNDFAAHASATAGIAGMNAGSLASMSKPTDATGLAMSGALGQSTQMEAGYSGNGFLTKVQSSTQKGKDTLGYGYVADGYKPTGILDVHGQSLAARTNADVYIAGGGNGVSNGWDKVAEIKANPGAAWDKFTSNVSGGGSTSPEHSTLSIDDAAMRGKK
jgi:hypothetical protein